MSVRKRQKLAGLPPEEALEYWSDPIAYAGMRDFEDASTHRSFADPVRQNAYQLRHREYRIRRDALEAAFLDSLAQGNIVASGIAPYSEAREIIHPSLWPVLEIDYEFDQILGKGRQYSAAEFFDPPHVPANVADAFERDQLAGARRSGRFGQRHPAEDDFQHDPTYKHIVLRGRDFRLGKAQAGVVAALHRAFREGDPWRSGKTILGEVGSESSRMRDVFKSQKHWCELILSDGRGEYMLNLTPRAVRSRRRGA